MARGMRITTRVTVGDAENSMMKHIVIDDKLAYKIAPNERKLVRYPLVIDTNTLEGLWQLGQEMKVTHIWPMPDCQLNEEIFRKGAEEGFDIFHTWEDEESKSGLKFARFWKKNAHGHQIRIGCAQRGRFQWKIEHPLDVLATIDYLESELGVPVSWSPGWIGTELLKLIHSSERHQSWIRPITTDIKDIPYNLASRDLLFLRPLGEVDNGKYIHCFDKNSAYLAAMQDLYCGSGDPIHREINQWMTAKRPLQEGGIYRVRMNNGSRFNGEELPLVFTKEWCTTEQLNFAYEHYAGVFIYEAYVFEESHKIMRDWSIKLWAARTSLRDAEKYPYSVARKNAESAVKQIALIGAGKLAAEYETPFRKRNWQADYIGRARMIMLHNILAQEGLHGQLPFLVYSDELHYVHRSSDARVAFPDILRREEGLGGYKHKSTVKITPELVEMSKCGSVGKMQAYIGGLARDGK